MELTLTIQPMGYNDLIFAAGCTAGEGWASETYAEFEGFYRHDPQGCLIARQGEEPVGICIATPYIHSGFVGELIVSPQARGRGIGAALLDHAVAYLKERGARTVYLDGVVTAVPLYERHGFRKICRSLRFSGHLPGQLSPLVQPMLARHLPEICRLDQQAFGDERGTFLERHWQRYPDLCKVLVEDGVLRGYITGRRGDGYVAVGPWVAAEISDPLPLLEGLALEAGEALLSIGMLESNPRAVEIARRLGLSERLDSPWRMALGPDDDLGRSPQCLAVGTAAKG